MSRLLALSRLLDALGRNALRLVWAGLLLLLLASGGNWLWQQQVIDAPPPREARVPTAIDWRAVDQAVVAAIAEAHRVAREHARAGLVAWRDTLRGRIDADFLDWYFSYWTQQRLGLEGLYAGGRHLIDPTSADAAEAVTATIQQEFSSRVLRPSVSQLLLERLTRESLDRFVTSLREGLAPLPERYRVPQVEWQRYLDGIAVLTHSVAGDRRVDLSLKALTAGGVAGSVVLARALTPAFATLGAKVSGNLAGKGAAALAARSGAKVAASSGGKLLGPIIGLGIVIWDLWDHDKTREENLPLLRGALYDYTEEMTQLLLDDPESGVMSVIHRVEQTMQQSLTRG